MTSLSLQTQNSTPFNTAIITANTVPTMTSLEIVEFINNHRQANGNNTVLAHSDFMRKVPEVLGEEGSRNFSDTYTHPQNKQTYPCYVFQKREACLMAMSYSYDLQAEIYDRMTAMEQMVLQPKLPSNFKEALQFLIEAEEQKEQLALQVAQQQQVIEVIQPKADVYDIIANRDNTYTIRDTAKLLKMRPKDLTDWLLANGWIYGKTSATYKPFAAHDRNHLKLVASNYGTQVRVTGKGLVWLARKLKVELESSDFE
ncbi:phage antirepressor KilAC domain protein [Acinetobacter sp. 1294596]|jgi:anti-repressor protein|uniref:phage antirepressor KilAC domain-containing protein n=1 Tax=Acinetobacter TaxID=469 RepID=UPI0004490E5C|nr:MULTISPECIES: phage antirepressor KilAC domain-containing protein [Acinetobacter]EXF56634.1 phage antirepressor KilAC domain protein [Acinetobacter sp. 1294596]MDH1408481.1 phage antirepressor KilAC domain-containing protein [Acinetobacter johnsonii]